MTGNELFERWESLESRERAVLGAGALLTLVILVYSLIWAPLSRDVTILEAEVLEDKERVEAMKVWAQDVRQWQDELKGSVSASSGGTALMTVVVDSAKQVNLNIQQWQPVGSHKINVNMDGVSFDDLMKWLSILHRRHNVNATQVKVAKTKDEGKVSARITLEEPSS